MSKRTDKMTMDMAVMVADILREQMPPPAQPAPQVNDMWSGIVALARSSGLDGRVGPGDILVGVSLAGAGFVIGGIGATAQGFAGAGFEQSVTWLEYCTTAGCTLGLLRLTLDALAIPAMLTQVLDWLYDVVELRCNDGVEDEDEPEPRTMRQISYTTATKQEGMSIDVGPAQVWTLEIPSKTLKSGWRPILWKDVRTFIHAACATGNWTRDKQTVLDQKTHADLKRYLEDTNEDRRENWPIPMWGFDSPARPVALEILRNKLTNGTARTEPNEGTGR